LLVLLGISCSQFNDVIPAGVTDADPTVAARRHSFYPLPSVQGAK